jgi:hypothetical protein
VNLCPRFPARSAITARQPLSSHSRSNTSAGPIRWTAILIAASLASALSTIALAENRAPERNRLQLAAGLQILATPSVAIAGDCDDYEGVAEWSKAHLAFLQVLLRCHHGFAGGETVRNPTSIVPLDCGHCASAMSAYH